MSYNGSGTFLINTAGQPVVSGTVISSTAFNALTADLATGLSTAITKDGQTTVTANIPMGTYKFTGLGAGTAATDSANLSQVQSTVTKLLASVSGADTITAVGSPTLGAYAAGQMFYFVAAGDNTGAVTLNIDSLGAKAVTRDGSVALAAGDIKSGEVVVVVYDGTRFQVVSQLNSAGNATFANVSITSALNVGGVATFTGGTANGVTYLNGSKALTSGSALVFDGTNLGIGTSSPAYKLDVSTTTGDTQAAIYDRATGSSAARLDFRTSGTGASQWFIQTGNTTGGLNGALRFYNQGTGSEVARFDSSGNLGLGVAPNTWSTGKAFEVGTSGLGLWGVAGNNVVMFSGAYYNSAWKYSASAAAAAYEQNAGAHNWKIAASGTAGNNITFTQAMTLDASGRLGIGETSPTEKLQISAGKIKITGATVASGIASNTFRVSGTQNVADDATVTVGIANASLVFVAENTAGNGILFFCGYSSGTVVKIADPAGIGATADTDGFICATKSATSSDINIKNRLGSTKGLTITVFSVAD